MTRSSVELSWRTKNEMNFTFHNNVNWFLSLFRIYDSKTQSKKYNLIQFFPERVIWRLCRGLTPNFIIEQLRLPSRSFDRILFLFVLLFMFFFISILNTLFFSAALWRGIYSCFRFYFCFAKDWFLIGQEQSCTRIIQFFVWLTLGFVYFCFTFCEPSTKNALLSRSSATECTGFA